MLFLAHPRRTWARHLGAAAALGPLLLALGCGSATEPSDVNTVVSLTNADHGRTVAVLVSDTIEITLGTVGPGNYGTPVLSSGSVRFQGTEYPRLQNPGGPTQIYRFEAVAVGRADIAIPHMGGFPTSRNPFAITIEVR